MDKPSDSSLRVASRYLVARGYFEAGDVILYGKYKNKKGRIIRVFEDEKGHPSIEVEPMPKGRKKNKVMGLYKIWHAPSAEEGDED